MLLSMDTHGGDMKWADSHIRAGGMIKFIGWFLFGFAIGLWLRLCVIAGQWIMGGL